MSHTYRAPRPQEFPWWRRGVSTRLRSWFYARSPVSRRIVIGLALASVCCFGAPLLASRIYADAGARHSGNESAWEAWNIAKQLVQQNTASSTALTFPRMTARFVTHLGGGLWEVQAYADGQTDFGAHVRYYFTVDAEHRSDDLWYCEKLNIKSPLIDHLNLHQDGE